MILIFHIVIMSGLWTLSCSLYVCVCAAVWVAVDPCGTAYIMIIHSSRCYLYLFVCVCFGWFLCVCVCVCASVCETSVRCRLAFNLPLFARHSA